MFDEDEPEKPSLRDMFEAVDDQYGKFENIPEDQRKHPQSDVCALMYVYEKNGGKNPIAGAEHDVIYIALDEDAPLTEEDVLYLTRCGVMIADYGFQMYA